MGLHSKAFAAASSLRHTRYARGDVGVVTTTKMDLGVITHPGVIKRLLVAQRYAGAGVGANFTIEFHKLRAGAAAVDLLATDGVLTRAAGAGAAVDTASGRGSLATPAGCTKPVFVSDAAKLRVQPGDTLYATITHDAAYGTPPDIEVAALVQSDL